jgi:cytochrome P450
MQPKSAAAGNAAGACPGFDPAKLEKTGLLAAAIAWLAGYPVHRYLLGVLRWFTPVFRVPFADLWIVLRYDAVREVLSRDADFPVPWDRKMESVTAAAQGGGRNFVLGMARDDKYRLSYAQLAKAFPLEDVGKHVAPLSKTAAEGIIDGLGRDPEFDAIEELITRVPTQLCQDYYGIKIDDMAAFAKWTLAISSYLFGPPFDKPKPLRSKNEPPLDVSSEDAQFAHAAAACLSRTIYRAIAAEKARRQAGEEKFGVALPNLLDLQAATLPPDKPISDEDIHVQLFGMVMGFIPTNVLAGGNMLDTLLNRPEFLKRARDAALADDDELLWRCLRETLRFRNINLGPFRVSAREYVVERGGYDEARIPAGAAVLASTQAAMFDARRVKHPQVFDPGRPDEDYMMFSVGQHWCLGAYIAIAQLTQTFKPLLRREGLARVDDKRGRMQRFNVFPLHMFVRYRP